MRRATIGNVTTVALAKNMFQVHGVDADGVAVTRQRLTRGRMLKFFVKLPPYLVGIEAYATSHYWARELVALGHDARLMPAQYVKPYVKRGKNDAADAEAICEAVTGPTMRFVGIKSLEQQSAIRLHHVCLILNRQHAAVERAKSAPCQVRHRDADRQERPRPAPRCHSRWAGAGRDARLQNPRALRA